MSGLVKERREKKWVHYSLDGSGSSVFPRKILGCLKGWLNDDPVVARDRTREAIAREIGPEGICGRGMTLPAGPGARCRPPAGKGTGVDKSAARRNG